MDTLPPELIDTLKKIAAYADLNRKFIKWSLIFLPFLVVLAASLIFIGSVVEKAALKKADEKLDWYSVESSRRSGDLEKALKAADELLAKTPRDFEMLYKKGQIQLILGDREGAKQSFRAASDIFPIYPYKQAFDAIVLQEKNTNSSAP